MLPPTETTFPPTWESLRSHGVPDWFRDAKLGIWSHWGPQSVPEAGDWYARHLYGPYDGTEDFETERSARQRALHEERYGHPSAFGHKDIVNLWRAERFDPDALMDLYRRAGARYFVSLAAHCDNVDLWDSAHQPWNATRVGPRTNVLGRWEQAARAAGLHFGVSVHSGSWTWRWFDSAFGADDSGPHAGVPYDGHLTAADGAGTWWEGLDPRDLYGRPRRPGEPPDPGFVDDYYDRLDDLVTQHRPEIIYLDDARLPFDTGSVCEAQPPSDRGLRWLAAYYEAAREWYGADGLVSIKTVPDADRAAILLDVERGQLETAQDQPWQICTSIGDWFYRRGEVYKTPRQLVHMLVDTVSKNGCLLLNVPQRPDGTVDEECTAILTELGSWLDVAGPAIHGTRPWKVFGEGPTNVVVRPGYNEADLPYTAADVRFTCTPDAVYAILLAWPDDGVARITSLGTAAGLLDRRPAAVDLLGAPAPLDWDVTAEALTVRLPPQPPTGHAHVLRVR